MRDNLASWDEAHKPVLEVPLHTATIEPWATHCGCLVHEGRNLRLSWNPGLRPVPEIDVGMFTYILKFQRLSPAPLTLHPMRKAGFIPLTLGTAELREVMVERSVSPAWSGPTRTDPGCGSLGNQLPSSEHIAKWGW